MKILFLITRGDSIGGAQIHVRDLAKMLQQDGHAVTVAFGKRGSFSTLLEDEGIAYRLVNGLGRNISLFQDIQALKNILSLIVELDPDIVALHSSKMGILGRIAAKIAKKPTIFTVHGWSFTEGKREGTRKFYQLIEKVGAFLSGRIITVSEYDRNLALRYRIAGDKKIQTIHNGVPDIDMCSSRAFALDQPTLTMIARFQEPKDHKMLIDVLSELQYLPWKLQLVGEDGGNMHEIKNLVDKLGMNERVEILGDRRDIDLLLAQSDIFILVSKWEGFPLTILEAMRAGVSVIASNVGGVSEAVVDGETGYLVHSSSDLKVALSRLLISSSTREEMGKAGRQRYEKYFTFEAMYQETYRVYKEVTKFSR